MSSWWMALRRRFRRKSRSDQEPGGDASDEWLALMGRVAADRDARRNALRGMEEVVASVMSALHKADPIGLVEMGSPDDEYESEAETIVMRLADRREIVSVEDAVSIVHEEFVRWFSEDMAGERDRYEAVGADVHTLWQDYLLDG